MSQPHEQPDTDYLVLGVAPRPTSGDDLERLLRTLLTATNRSPARTVAELERIQLRGEMHDANITLLEADLSGVVISIGANTSAPPTPAARLSTVVSRTGAVLHTLKARANPITVGGVDCVAEARIDTLLFTWLEDDKSQLAVAERVDGDQGPRIHARAQASRGAIIARARKLIDERLAVAGVWVESLVVELLPTGPRAAEVVVSAKLRKGILSASAQLTAHGEIDDAMVLHVTEARLSSKNPLVAAVLIAVRERVDAAVADPIDLNRWMPAWLALRDIRVEFGEQLVVEVSFA